MAFGVRIGLTPPENEFLAEREHETTEIKCHSLRVFYGWFKKHQAYLFSKSPWGGNIPSSAPQSHLV